MSNNALLRQGIEDALAVIKNDDKVIQTICQLLNVKYPLEEQAVQDNLTRSEAITLVRELTHSSWTERAMLDFVDCLSGLSVLKLKEEKEDYISVSQTMKKDRVRTVYVTYALINHVANKLRNKCKDIFGICLSDENAIIFARTAITEYEFERTKDNEKSCSIKFTY